MRKIRKGDNVIVISGRDKGRKGAVVSVLDDGKLIVGCYLYDVALSKELARAGWVVPAVEGYSVTLPPLGRYQLPVQSLIVATEPLSDAIWADIGLEHGQAFSDCSSQVTYGQRTLDNRLVFGARGGYRFAGRLRSDFNLSEEERGLRAVHQPRHHGPCGPWHDAHPLQLLRLGQVRALPHRATLQRQQLFLLLPH